MKHSFIFVYKQPALETDIDIAISVSQHFLREHKQCHTKHHHLLAIYYLSRQFTAAIKEDIRRQSEAGSSQLYCFSHHCKAGEPEYSKAPAKSSERCFIPKNRSAICAKRCRKSRPAQRNGAGGMCVNKRNVWTIGEGDSRHCDWFDLVNIFLWRSRCKLCLRSRLKVCLGALKQNCVLSWLDRTLSTPLRLDNKMIQWESRFHPERTGILSRWFKKKKESKALKAVLHLLQGNERTFLTVQCREAINFTWDAIYTMLSVCWTNLALHCAAALFLSKRSELLSLHIYACSFYIKLRPTASQWKIFLCLADKMTACTWAQNLIVLHMCTTESLQCPVLVGGLSWHNFKYFTRVALNEGINFCKIHL